MVQDTTLDRSSTRDTVLSSSGLWLPMLSSWACLTPGGSTSHQPRHIHSFRTYTVHILGSISFLWMTDFYQRLIIASTTELFYRTTPPHLHWGQLTLEAMLLQGSGSLTSKCCSMIILRSSLPLKFDFSFKLIKPLTSPSPLYGKHSSLLTRSNNLLCLTRQKVRSN